MKNLIKNESEFEMTKLIQGEVDHYCLFSKKYQGKNPKNLRNEFNEHFTEQVIKRVLAPFELPYTK